MSSVAATASSLVLHKAHLVPVGFTRPAPLSMFYHGETTAFQHSPYQCRTGWRPVIWPPSFAGYPAVRLQREIAKPASASFVAIMQVSFFLRREAFCLGLFQPQPAPLGKYQFRLFNPGRCILRLVSRAAGRASPCANTHELAKFFFAIDKNFFFFAVRGLFVGA